VEALVNRAKCGDVDFKQTWFGRHEAIFAERDRKASGPVTIGKGYAGSQEP